MSKDNGRTVRRRPALSIFVKCVGILAVATALVTGVQAYLSYGLSRTVAADALREMANDVTELTAKGLAGAVRFNKPDDIRRELEQLMVAGEGKAISAIVIAADGTPLGQAGDSGPDMSALAATALERGARVSSEDGFVRAVPIGVDETGVARGAVAVAWSPELYYEGISESFRSELLLAGLLFLGTLLIAGFAYRQSISVPLRAVAARTTEMADGNYESAVPSRGRGDEIGDLARQLDVLRERLETAQQATRDAVFQGAGFQATSAALAMTDLQLAVIHHNKAFQEFSQQASGAMRKAFPGFDPAQLTGLNMGGGTGDFAQLRNIADSKDFPQTFNMRLDEATIELVASRVLDAEGTLIGFILEWSDITADATNMAVIQALEAAQLRADFDADGRLKSSNEHFRNAFSGMAEAGLKLREFARPKSDATALDRVARGRSVFDTFVLGREPAVRLVRGSISPTLNRNGEATGFVLLGTDITEAEAEKDRARARDAEREAAQKQVVEGLGAALDSLARGNLTARISTPFAEDYETLRSQFNTSLGALDDAVGTVLMNASAILGETGNISNAADDLSRRTEQQAATLEEFAAALTQLTASVASSAEGATQASSVVLDARKNAEASGSVVREAVDAMGEIASSSDQISRIISVIDDIAFQTNLLALNAGVEAARAGDAGRGFAVVASEVRALAQRSSDAAREINTLISTSGNHVKRGVALVDKAGQALNEIVTSVADIADHVTGIAASAREQSTGLEEINAAINQLDQVTQQNVAMFEETTAATHTLTREANELVKATSRFTASSGRPVSAEPRITAGGASARKPSFASSRGPTAPAQPAPGPARASAPPVSGQLALSDPEEDDWEDF